MMLFLRGIRNWLYVGCLLTAVLGVSGIIELPSAKKARLAEEERFREQISRIQVAACSASGKLDVDCLTK